ncbi:MAG: glycosyltransferase family 4 protein [Bdellovibrionota bacterium]|nr:glycosyltransferase family 4 protein [Bdellovibrionota bacterium]
MKPTVLHVCISPGLGGLELYSLQLHKKFKSEGYPSLHFCLEDSPFEEKLLAEGLESISFKKAKYFSPSITSKMRKIIIDRNIEKIFVHHLKDLWFLVPALRGLEKVELVGFAQMFIKDISKKDFLHSWLYNRMKNLITLTDLQKEQLKKCLPLKEERYITIPNSIELSKTENLEAARETIRTELSYSSTDKVIGIVGRLDPWKGQLELLQAFVSIEKKYPDTRLLIVGSETPGEEGYKQKLVETILENNLSHKVQMIGFQKNVPEWMSAMDIFVMPSYEEAFGIVLAEAMCVGLPVISTKAGGVPDILVSEKYGQMVEPRSAKAIEMALVKYLDDEAYRNSIALAGQTYAREAFDFEKAYVGIKSLIQL